MENNNVSSPQTNEVIQQLRKALVKMGIVLDSVSEAIVWTDQKKTIQWCNAVFDRLIHRSHTDVIGQNLISLFPLYQKGKPVRDEEHPGNIKGEGQVLSDQTYEFKRNGQGYFLEISVNRVPGADKEECTILTVRDISLKKKMEHDLHLAQFAMDHAGDPIFLIDRAGKFLYVNEGACRVLGHSREEFLSLSISDVTSDFSKERWHQLWIELETMKSVRIDTVGKRKDGAVFPVEVVLSLQELEDRRFACVFVRDMTERKKSEDLKQRLLHMDRFAAIGRLAGGVAHEINNPAAVVTTNLALLKEEMDGLKTELISSKSSFDIQEIQEILGECEDGMKRIVSIVKDLGTFRRVEHDYQEEVDINDVIRASSKLIYNEVRHHARLVLDLNEIPRIRADRGKIGQVILNLIGNAAEAIPEGNAEKNQIRIITKKKDNNIAITIEDTGCGIPMDVRSKIFDPFFTTKPVGEAAGLGLTISREIIKKHGGEIQFESRNEKGSQFEITLPIALEKETSKGKGGVETPEAKSSKRRIFLIDDDLLLLSSFRRILEVNHEVVAVASGKEALSILGRDTDFDVVICDVMMPDTDGPMIYEFIRENVPHLLNRIVFTTAGTFTPRTKDFINTVSNQILEKPISSEALYEVLERIEKIERF